MTDVMLFGKSWRGNLRDVIGSTGGWGGRPEVDIQWVSRHPDFSGLCNTDTPMAGREALSP